MGNRFFPNYGGYKITSRYGMRTLRGVRKMHNGIDLVAKTKSGGSATDHITAHTGGTVRSVGYDKSAGYYVTIQVDASTYMAYYHMRSACTLKKGAKVSKGQVLGYMGSTGNSTGAHLHWGIKKNGSWIDPAPYLDADYPSKTNNKEECSVNIEVLKKGAEGDTVKALQILLIGYGYKMENNGKTYGADGSFGAATDKALRAYQSANGLDPDGSVGPKTWAKLLGV